MKYKISLYVENNKAFNFIMLSLILHTVYLLITLNSMVFSWRILSFTLYGIVYTLLTFYLATNVKVYDVKSSYYIVALNIINIIRLFITPTKLTFTLITTLLLSTAIAILVGIFSSKFAKKRQEYIDVQKTVND